MGSNHDAYVLRWSEFQCNVTTSFQSLRGEEDFFDVTLACDEDHQVQAHKVILAASSGFFRGLLKRNPGPNPILIMPPNVTFSELSHLLDFMYNGEVSVTEDDLNVFMEAASKLQLVGLTDNNSPAGEGLLNVHMFHKTVRHRKPPKKRRNTPIRPTPMKVQVKQEMHEGDPGGSSSSTSVVPNYGGEREGGGGEEGDDSKDPMDTAQVVSDLLSNKDERMDERGEDNSRDLINPYGEDGPMSQHGEDGGSPAGGGVDEIKSEPSQYREHQGQFRNSDGTLGPSGRSCLYV